MASEAELKTKLEESEKIISYLKNKYE